MNLKDFGGRLVYMVSLLGLGLLRISPRFMVTAYAHIGAFFLSRGRKFFRISDANLWVVFPDWDAARRKKVIRKSALNFILCLLEYIWASCSRKRLERSYLIDEEETAKILARVAAKERTIYVNPHMASWEGASATVARFHRDGAGIAVIVKAVKNPYMDKLFNNLVRGRVEGVHVIYSVGALRGTIKAFNAGSCLGILIDQNTKVREGGEFMDFFGLPAPSSLAPAVLAKYCLEKKMPSNICYSMAVREEDGKIHFHTIPLSRPLEEYASNHEIIQEILDISTREIAKRPEQYLWGYPRFRNIPRDASPELAAKFPSYAKPASESFYDAKVYHERHARKRAAEKS